MDRAVQAGAIPITSCQYVFELQQDWARSETYEGVMNILRGHSPYGIQVRFSKWALGEHASEGGARQPNSPRCLRNGRSAMKIYLLSAGAGILVGVIYSLLNVRSPAPPLVALVGLLGILIGEQVIPVSKQLLSGNGLAAAWRQAQCARISLAFCPAARRTPPRWHPMPWEETFMSTPDLILHHGLFTTLDRGNPTASAVAIKDGMFVAVGHDSEVIKLAGPSTRVIDLKGKRVLPGLIDNHLHIIRGGLTSISNCAGTVSGPLPMP